MALVNMLSNKDTYIYDDASAAAISSTKSQVILSAGFKF
jgi:hypothetical protein